jgi:hypothetical protein
MALAALAAPVVAQGAMVGNGGVDILGKGIFESDGNAFQFPVFADTNYGSVTMGNDKALAFGMGNGWPWTFVNGPANAQNNVEVKKNQDSGPCDSCCAAGSSGSCALCQDACSKINTDMIKLGNTEAMAFGFASATNNIKVVSNQV